VREIHFSKPKISTFFPLSSLNDSKAKRQNSDRLQFLGYQNLALSFSFSSYFTLLYVLELQGGKKVSSTTLLLMILPHLLTESKNKSKKQTCSSRTLVSKKRFVSLSFLHTTERKVH
jgi:hypothetical protein